MSRPHAEGLRVCAAPRAGLPRPLPPWVSPFSPSPASGLPSPVSAPLHRARGTCLVHPSLESCDNFAAFWFSYCSIYSDSTLEGRKGSFCLVFSPAQLSHMGPLPCGKALGVAPLLSDPAEAWGSGVQTTGWAQVTPCWAPASWGKGAVTPLRSSCSATVWSLLSFLLSSPCWDPEGVDAKGVNLVLELRNSLRRSGEDGGCLTQSAASPHGPTPWLSKWPFRVQGGVVQPSPHWGASSASHWLRLCHSGARPCPLGQRSLL